MTNTDSQPPVEWKIVADPAVPLGELRVNPAILGNLERFVEDTDRGVSLVFKAAP